MKLKGLDANEESTKRLSGDTTLSVLHFATHGFFYPDPATDKQAGRSVGGTVFKQSENPLFRSGLVMAGGENTWKGKPVHGLEDGILTAYEVAAMYLPATRLVVLSACQTGLGDIHGSEGVYGLQRAFKIAGVQHLLMSLWEVQDDVTFEFMQNFYNNMFESGSVTDAFYRAQSTMKNKYRYEPYKWAAWILVR
jgi:CHAT domain-containing protein